MSFVIAFVGALVVSYAFARLERRRHSKQLREAVESLQRAHSDVLRAEFDTRSRLLQLVATIDDVGTLRKEVRELMHDEVYRVVAQLDEPPRRRPS